MRRIWGILLLPVCLFLVLGLLSYHWQDVSLLKAPPNSPPANLIGPVGAWVSLVLFMGLGIGAFLVPLWLLGCALLMIVVREGRVWPRALWLGVGALAATGLTELGDTLWAPAMVRLNLSDAGGLFGRVIMQSLLVHWLSPFGAGLLAGGTMLIAVILGVELHNVVRLWRALLVSAAGMRNRTRGTGAARDEDDKPAREERRERRRALALSVEPRTEAPPVAPSESEPEPEVAVTPPPAEPDPADSAASRRAARLARLKAEPPRQEIVIETPVEPEPEPVPPEEPEPAAEPAPRPAPSPRARPATPPPPEGEEEGDAAAVPSLLGAVPPPSNYQLPPMSLLREAVGGGPAVAIDTATTGQILVETLNDFGIEAEITNVEKGPVVTSYELLPAPGVRIERISGLSNNLALALKATSVRVQAPVPGKGVVGIEVPNAVAKAVLLREILECEKWRSPKIKIPLALGKDVSGNDLIADLADMPHMLIAGATGSGKTVCMNSILAGLLMSRTPEQLRLLLVDPKIVEFAAYNHLPHLVVPVVTDPKKVSLGLRWAINEMEKRYKLFARVGVRNIETYNNREVARQELLFGDQTPPPEDEPPARLPYIVIIIDELADLMLAAQADIETGVARLAQLSRAVGIHMILSTQRPSVNVITGTIKANFPARLAFQVAQKVDSRTILDSIGAEKLLGRGDMLFLPPGTSKLVRAQGCLTTDEEIHGICSFIKNQSQPAYEVEIKERIEKTGDASLDDEADDELINQAVGIIRETKRASTSSLQRRLRIGYTRAARIMDILEERGIIGPPRGSDPREILIDLDGDIPNNPTTPAGDGSDDGP